MIKKMIQNHEIEVIGLADASGAPLGTMGQALARGKIQTCSVEN